MIGAINRSFKRNVKRKVHYGWVILGLTFTNLMIEGGAKNVQPVFLVAFRDSFRSSTTLASAIFSVSGLVGGVSAPFLGRLLDRFGPRVMFPIAATVILVGWLASSMAGEMWQLFIFYSVIATLGQFTISSFSATATLAPWFPRSKGIVLGMADSGNPAGQAIVVPLAQLIVTTMGWRTAYQGFGVAFFLLGAPLNLLFQRRPPDASPDVVEETEGPGEAAEAAAPEAEPEAPNRIPIREALSYPPVWFLLSGRFGGQPDDDGPHHRVPDFVRVRGAGCGGGPGRSRSAGDWGEARVRLVVRRVGPGGCLYRQHGDAGFCNPDGAAIWRRRGLVGANVVCGPDGIERRTERLAYWRQGGGPVPAPDAGHGDGRGGGWPWNRDCGRPGSGRGAV